jgi:DNA-3-methyladenine glycosylase II
MPPIRKPSVKKLLVNKPLHVIIETDDDVRTGLRALRRKCAILRRAHDLAGDPPLRRQLSGFEGLARIIVGQQLSVASAAAIWGRCQLAIRPMTARKMLAAPDEVLRACGLSGGKIRTLRAISTAIRSKELDLDLLEAAPDLAVQEALQQVSGIGPWTADIYLMFCLGRADAFAAGDLALQVAAAIAAERGERLTLAELEELAETWRPWRGVAARLLWAYYAAVKAQKSAVPV